MQKESIYDRMTNAEREVATVLKKMGIQWSYEQPLFVWDENKRPRVWAPDFYLIQFGIYIEVCGSSSFNYAYRRKILNNNGYQVIYLHLFKNNQQWKKHLLNYLVFFVNLRNNKLDKLLSSD